MIDVYKRQPVDLLYKYGTLPIVGFGMLLSGIVAAILFHQPNSYAMWDVWLSLIHISYTNVLLWGIGIVVTVMNIYLLIVG